MTTASPRRAAATRGGPGRCWRSRCGEFNTRGYDATSMEDLSRAAGITKSSFYHHFSGKEALLRAALERALDGLFAILDEPEPSAGTALTRLRHIVRGRWRCSWRSCPT